METLIDLKCSFCNKPFQKRLTEHKRCLRDGMAGTFCSRRCSCDAGRVSPAFKQYKPSAEHLKHIERRDEFSPFRVHMRNCRRRGKTFELSVEYLKELWEQQDGKCPYTGWSLKNAACSSDQLPLTPDRASLDRIDSSKGYVKGNVQFVSYMAQCAKNSFPEGDLYAFCEAVYLGKQNVNLLSN